MAEPATTPAGPGGDLRAAREARGLSVHQLAQELHVSDAMISALERGDYAALGEPVFVRGHLRNYARAVGIAEAEVLSRYELTQNKPAAPTLITTAPISGMSTKARDRSLKLASAAVAVVLLVLAGTWWQHRNEETSSTAPVQTAVTALPAPVTAPVSTVADLGDQAPPAAAPLQKPAAVTPPAAMKPAAQPVAEAPKPAVAAVAHVTHAAKPVAPAPASVHNQQVTVGAGDAHDLTHVKFTLSSASWVEVYDNNGKRLYYDLAPAGDSLELSGSGPLQVFLGNAPGVSVELNGSPFDLRPYARPDNTARFKLSNSGGSGG